MKNQKTKVEKVNDEINSFKKLWGKNPKRALLILFVILFAGVVSFWPRQKTQKQTIHDSPKSIQVMTGDKSTVIITQETDGVSEKDLSPNAYRDITDRLNKIGYIGKYTINDERDFEKPISFLSQFIESKTKINLSPIIVTLKIHEIRTNRETYFDKISPIDAIEYLRSHLITKRYPLEAYIYPAAVMKVSGKGVEFKVGKK